MLHLTPSMNYYLYPYPADMRRGFHSLSGLIHDVMGKDIRSGDVFIFINRYCTGMKILHMEYGQALSGKCQPQNRTHQLTPAG